MGNGAEVFHEFLMRHADAVIGESERTRFFIGGDVDFERERGLVDVLLGAFDVAEFLHRVRRIGDQLAEEDFLVRVE